MDKPITIWYNLLFKLIEKNMEKHGMSYERVYRIWAGIKQRCLNENCCIYYKYGAEGINICDGWLTFENFFSDMGYPPTDNHTIDRIDGSKGYFKNNCRWATYQQQNTNLKMLKTNTSGYTGVSWSKKEKRWLCIISINNKSKRIGGFKTIEEAVNARNDFIKENNLPHKTNEFRK